MNDLLNLASCERAEALMLRVGRPPVIVLLGDRHEVGASKITDADVEDFLLCIADTRQRREIWVNGQATFIYMKGESERFLVRVWMEGEHMVLEIK